MNNNTNDGPRRKPHRAMAFLQNKIFIIFFLPVIAMIIIIAVALILRAVKSPAEKIPADVTGDYIYVLPIKERPADNILPADDKDPFSGSGTPALYLGGIIYNPDGKSNAVILTADKSYVVQQGDLIGKTGWVVNEITADTVTIIKNEKSEILSMPAKAADGLYEKNTEVS